MPIFENAGAVNADNTSGAALERQEQIHSLAVQAQNTFFAAVMKFEATGYDPNTIHNQWKGDSAPMLGTFLRICRESFSALGLQDISENSIVRVAHGEPDGNRIAMAAGHTSGEILSVFLKDHLVYSVTRDEDFPPDVSADPKDIPADLRTEEDTAFDRPEFERALSELLNERTK